MGIGVGSVLVPWRPFFWNAAEVVLNRATEAGRQGAAPPAPGGGAAGAREGGQVLSPRPPPQQAGLLLEIECR